MAKSGNRGGGPGTNDRGGVRSTMNPPFGGASKGSQQTMPGPFNKPRSGGGENLPTRIKDNLGGKASFSQRDELGTILTDPHGNRAPYR